MKINKYWIVILLILVAGFWSTSFTKRYRDQLPQTVSEAMLENEAASDASGSSASAVTAFAGGLSAADGMVTAGKSSETGTGAVNTDAGYEEAAVEDGQTEIRSDVSKKQTGSEDGQVILDEAAATDSDAVSEADAAAGAPFPKAVMEYSREKTAGSAAAKQSLVPLLESESSSQVQEEGSGQSDAANQTETSRVNAYLNRLQDLDAQLVKGHSISADTTNSLKAASEQKLGLWETELDRILDALEKRLSNEETEALFKEQKEWFRDREDAAVSASKRKSGSTLEEVEYNVSLADSTRARAYELAEKYAEILTEAE